MWLRAWRYKRFHVSVLLAWLSLGLLAGLYAGQFVVAQPWWWGLMLVIVSASAFKSRRWYTCVIMIAVGLGFGLLRGATYKAEVMQLTDLSSQKIVLSGAISQDPVLKNGSNLWQAQLQSIRVNQRDFAGEVYATIVSDEGLKRGDNVQLAAQAHPGFGSFQLSLYRAELQHVDRPSDPFLAARDAFAAGTRRVVPEPEASLGLGFLVGQKTALPDDMAEQLKIVGLTHIVVASGYNLTILVRFARRVLARKSRYLALTGSLVLVTGFVLVSGLSPSMNRAAVVTGLSLLAWYVGRRFHPVKLILYVASMSALLYPVYIWGDLGWLLSFAAFSGVLVLAPLVTKLVTRADKPPGAFLQLLIETLSAELMTLPILAIAFGYLPVFALIANILVAPVIPFAMLFTFVAGLVGLVVPWLSVVALPASIAIAYVVSLVEWLASPAWASWALALPVWTAVLWYGLVVGLGLIVWKKRRVDLLSTSVVE